VHEHYWPKCDDGNPINGYWWPHDNIWVPGLITTETWFTPSPDYFWGKAVYYAPGVMEATAAWREFSLDDYVGGVSLMSPADIGDEVWIRPSYGKDFWGTGWEGPFLVVDCARKGDMWPVIMNRWEAVELDYKTALRWGIVNNDWGSSMRFVQVSKVDPMELDNIEWWELIRYGGIYAAESNGKEPPIYHPEWFITTVEYTDRIEPRVHFRPPNEWRINGEWHTFNHQPICPKSNSVLKLHRQPSYINLSRRK